ncbi:MAG: trypsin-like peptidase domain-containing protein [Spirochaetia bacterium]|nr:trypsin-like peptidase domain-containing protein [Treponema sp.]MCI6316682.1 trypsin-like peptidase domain-containing protein [Spirochaetia bacterium]MCI6365501.1 trypsin-like peptidase domain-containing protein [Spirochaetia bacterium]MDY2825192.1 trypsin-like peptidase domain-containing protein [Treponema sp.]MDY4768868.1 trypsin-like peptidase domain-containing protein [Treponema sp.]
MKLYTKSQLIFCTVIGMAIAAGVSSVISFNSRKNESAQSSSSKETHEISASSSEFVNIENTESDINSFPVSSDTTYTLDEKQNISIYEKCSPAVVNINTQVTGVNWFLEPIIQDGGSGSGSIIDKLGYVLTNVHVIKNASKIYVSLSDGTQYEAQIIGQDADSDLAVIKFNPPQGTELQTIPFGDSTKLKVGQKVIAIGNPYGFDRTMTTGIISALGRPIKDSSTNRIIRNMIQTDTAINPGNSGGPLLDTNGNMIGINTIIYSNSGSSAGIGFSVPAETAIRVASDLVKYGKVRRGILEISVVQLNNTIANYANLDISRGLLVSRTTKGGNADKAGVIQGTQAVRYGYSNSVIYLGGDIITKIDNISISSIADYYSALESKRPGDNVTVTLHRNRKDRTVIIKLASPDEIQKNETIM